MVAVAKLLWRCSSERPSRRAIQAPKEARTKLGQRGECAVVCYNRDAASRPACRCDMPLCVTTKTRPLCVEGGGLAKETGTVACSLEAMLRAL